MTSAGWRSCRLNQSGPSDRDGLPKTSDSASSCASAVSRAVPDTGKNRKFGLEKASKHNRFRETRFSQKPLAFGLCGFESHSGHSRFAATVQVCGSAALPGC